MPKVLVEVETNDATVEAARQRIDRALGSSLSGRWHFIDGHGPLDELEILSDIRVLVRKIVARVRCGGSHES